MSMMCLQHFSHKVSYNGSSKCRKNCIISYSANQKDFIDFVLEKYVEAGIDELDDSKLKTLIENKYQSLPDGLSVLGNAVEVRKLFIEFQQYLYQDVVA